MSDAAKEPYEKEALRANLKRVKLLVLKRKRAKPVSIKEILKQMLKVPAQKVVH